MITTGETMELAKVPGPRVWFHLLREGEQWDDPERLHTFGPFDTSKSEFVLEAPPPGPKLLPTEIQNRNHLKRLPASRRATVRVSVLNARDGVPIEGARLEGGSIASTVYGCSDAEGVIVGSSTVECLSMYVWAHGMKQYDLGSPDLQRGDDVDLGNISMEPLDRVRIQLTRADGSRTRSRWAVSYISRSASGSRSYVDSRADGTFDLLLDGDVPMSLRLAPKLSLRVASKFYTSRDGADAALTLSADGTRATCVVPDWQLVEIEVTGLDAVWRMAPAHLAAKHEDGKIARLYRAGTRGSATVFRSALFNGKWTVTSGPLVRLSSGPVQFTATEGGESLRLQATAGEIQVE